MEARFTPEVCLIVNELIHCVLRNYIEFFNYITNE